MHSISQVATAWIILTAIPNINSQFGYRKKDQHLWPKKYKLCAGKLQSPISIFTSKAISLPLPAIEMIGYHDPLPMPQTLMNNGETIKLLVNKSSVTHGRLPYIFGSTLEQNQQYEMEQLHFHWGARNNRGAEHILNEVRYPMEMHIVHRSMAYSNLSHALQHKDSLVVLAIFFQLQDEHNEFLQPLVNRIQYVKWVNTELLINISISLASLMPLNTDTYYTYKGSLTTPPCSEVVTWIIFATPVPISFHQMDTFRILSNGEETLEDNFRRLQDIGQRKIYVRRLHPWHLLKPENLRLNFTNLSWLWL